MCVSVCAMQNCVLVCVGMCDGAHVEIRRQCLTYPLFDKGLGFVDRYYVYHASQSPNFQELPTMSQESLKSQMPVTMLNFTWLWGLKFGPDSCVLAV